jgi:hypothetical protein
MQPKDLKRTKTRTVRNSPVRNEPHLRESVIARQLKTM